MRIVVVVMMSIVVSMVMIMTMMMVILVMKMIVLEMVIWMAPKWGGSILAKQINSAEKLTLPNGPFLAVAKSMFLMID